MVSLEVVTFGKESKKEVEKEFEEEKHLFFQKETDRVVFGTSSYYPEFSRWFE